MPTRFALPPVITASTWMTAAESLWRSPRRGDADDLGAPRWTNREAMAVINALRTLGKGSREGFRLWYQYAAVAYGWDPDDDNLIVTSSQADGDYPIEDTVLLGQDLTRIARDLDAAHRPDPRIELTDVFDKKTNAQEVSAALREDGADPAVQFKIALPACKDPKTGKATRPVKGADGKWSCPGGPITVDDPITAILKSLTSSPIVIAAVILIGASVIGKTNKRRGRRRR